MTLLEAIQLVQTRPAAEVSAEELALLREVVRQHPTFAAAVGGQTKLAEYLEEASRVGPCTHAVSPVAAAEPTGVQEFPPRSHVPGYELPRALAQPSTLSSAWVQAPTLPSARVPVPTVRSRRAVELSIYGLLVAAAVGLLYWQLAPFIHRADPSPPEVAAVNNNEPPPVVQTSQPALKPAAERQPGPAERIARTDDADESQAADAVEEPPPIHEWRGWQITREKGCATEFQSVWDLADPSKPEPVKLLITQCGVARLTCELEIPADAKMLALDCRQMVGTPDNPQAAAAPRAAGKITLSIDGRQTAASPVAAADYPGSLMLALGGAHGRRATFVLEYTSADPQERVIWRSFGFSRAPSEVLLASGEPEARNKHLRLWLRADSGVRDAAGRGPTEPGFDGTVQTWEDRSTGGRHLTSDTGDASRRPTFVPTEPRVANRPAVFFDSSNDSLQYSVGGVYAAGPSTTLAVFHLTHFHSTKDRKRTCVVFDAQPSGLALGINNGAGVKNGHTITFGPMNVSSSGQLHGQFVIATALSNGGASLLNVNGSLHSAGALTNVKGESTFVLGLPAAAPQGFNGYPTQLAELLVYDRALSDVELRQLGQYLAKRYGLNATY